MTWQDQQCCVTIQPIARLLSCQISLRLSGFITPGLEILCYRPTLRGTNGAGVLCKLYQSSIFLMWEDPVVTKSLKVNCRVLYVHCFLFSQSRLHYVSWKKFLSAGGSPWPHCSFLLFLFQTTCRAKTHPAAARSQQHCPRSNRQSSWFCQCSLSNKSCPAARAQRYFYRLRLIPQARVGSFRNLIFGNTTNLSPQTSAYQVPFSCWNFLHRSSP